MLGSFPLLLGNEVSNQSNANTLRQSFHPEIASASTTSSSVASSEPATNATINTTRPFERGLSAAILPPSAPPIDKQRTASDLALDAALRSSQPSAPPLRFDHKPTVQAQAQQQVQQQQQQQVPHQHHTFHHSIKKAAVATTTTNTPQVVIHPSTQPLTQPPSQQEQFAPSSVSKASSLLSVPSTPMRSTAQQSKQSQQQQQQRTPHFGAQGEQVRSARKHWQQQQQEEQQAQQQQQQQPQQQQQLYQQTQRQPSQPQSIPQTPYASSVASEFIPHSVLSKLPTMNQTLNQTTPIRYDPYVFRFFLPSFSFIYFFTLTFATVFPRCGWRKLRR
jgi:hypothetical protein